MENIKNISNFDGYKIDINGNVFSCFKRGYLLKSYKSDNWKKLKPTIGNHGYNVVTLYKDNKPHKKLVHRLVLENFIGECPKNMETRHLNGNKLDCRLENLLWGTHEENDKDKVIHGKMKTSLSSNQVEQIRQKYSSKNYTQDYLATLYNVGQDQISRIVNYKRWKLIN